MNETHLNQQLIHRINDELDKIFNVLKQRKLMVKLSEEMERPSNHLSRNLQKRFVFGEDNQKTKFIWLEVIKYIIAHNRKEESVCFGLQDQLINQGVNLDIENISNKASSAYENYALYESEGVNVYASYYFSGKALETNIEILELFHRDNDFERAHLHTYRKLYLGEVETVEHGKGSKLLKIHFHTKFDITTPKGESAEHKPRVSMDYTIFHSGRLTPNTKDHTFYPSVFHGVGESMVIRTYGGLLIHQPQLSPPIEKNLVEINQYYSEKVTQLLARDDEVSVIASKFVYNKKFNVNDLQDVREIGALMMGFDYQAILDSQGIYAVYFLFGTTIYKYILLLRADMTVLAKGLDSNANQEYFKGRVDVKKKGMLSIRMNMLDNTRNITYASNDKGKVTYDENQEFTFYLPKFKVGSESKPEITCREASMNFLRNEKYVSGRCFFENICKTPDMEEYINFKPESYSEKKDIQDFFKIGNNEDIKTFFEKTYHPDSIQRQYNLLFPNPSTK